MKGQLNRAELELERWRRGQFILYNFSSNHQNHIGETVNKDEQISLQETDETLSSTQSMMSLSTVTSPSVTTSVVVNNTVDNRAVNADEWEKERSALFQQLDEKVS